LWARFLSNARFLSHVGSTRQLMSGPPALNALQLSIPPALISAFTEASTILRRALQQVGAVPHCRPAPKKYRGAALDSAGNSSAPHTSRRIGQDRDKLAHLAEAIDKGFPSADERLYSGEWDVQQHSPSSCDATTPETPPLDKTCAKCGLSLQRFWTPP
jgi:hypothetical protein